MISRKIANMIILGVSIAMTLMVFAILIYLLFAAEFEDYYSTLISTLISFILGLGLCLYIWFNRNKMEH